MNRLLTTEEFLEEIPALRHQGYFRVHLSNGVDTCTHRDKSKSGHAQSCGIWYPDKQPCTDVLLRLSVMGVLMEKYSCKQLMSNLRAVLRFLKNSFVLSALAGMDLPGALRADVLLLAPSYYIRGCFVSAA